MKILLLENDSRLCMDIKRRLIRENYVVDACGDGEEGFLLALNSSNGYDLAVISRTLPVVDGLAILKAMRSKKIQIPVILTASAAALRDKIEGLDSGADDYLLKPFHVDELSARIRAMCRRPALLNQRADPSFCDLSLDLAKRRLVCGENHVILTPTEFHLMYLFLERPDTLLTRELLIQKVWETDTVMESGNLDNYIYLLRKHLSAIKSGCVLSSVYGSGYLLEKACGPKGRV